MAMISMLWVLAMLVLCIGHAVPSAEAGCATEEMPKTWLEFVEGYDLRVLVQSSSVLCATACCEFVEKTHGRDCTAYTFHASSKRCYLRATPSKFRKYVQNDEYHTGVVTRRDRHNHDSTAQGHADSRSQHEETGNHDSTRVIIIENLMDRRDELGVPAMTRAEVEKLLLRAGGHGGRAAAMMQAQAPHSEVSHQAPQQQGSQQQGSQQQAPQKQETEQQETQQQETEQQRELQQEEQQPQMQQVEQPVDHSEIDPFAPRLVLTATKDNSVRCAPNPTAQQEGQQMLRYAERQFNSAVRALPSVCAATSPQAASLFAALDSLVHAVSKHASARARGAVRRAVSIAAARVEGGYSQLQKLSRAAQLDALMQQKHVINLRRQAASASSRVGKPQKPLVNFGSDPSLRAALTLIESLEAQRLKVRRSEGWWQYELIVGVSLRQMHIEADKNNNNDAVVVQHNILGVFDSTRISQRNENGATFASDRVWAHPHRYDPAKKVVRYQGTALARTYDGGTICDLTSKPRRATLMFYCGHYSLWSANANDVRTPVITRLTETKTCEYEVDVATWELCSHPVLGKNEVVVEQVATSDTASDEVQDDDVKASLDRERQHVAAEANAWLRVILLSPKTPMSGTHSKEDQECRILAGKAGLKLGELLLEEAREALAAARAVKAAGGKRGIFVYTTEAMQLDAATVWAAERALESFRDAVASFKVLNARIKSKHGFENQNMSAADCAELLLQAEQGLAQAIDLRVDGIVNAAQRHHVSYLVSEAAAKEKQPVQLSLPFDVERERAKERDNELEQAAMSSAKATKAAASISAGSASVNLWSLAEAARLWGMVATLRPSHKMARIYSTALLAGVKSHRAALSRSKLGGSDSPVTPPVRSVKSAQLDVTEDHLAANYLRFVEHEFDGYAAEYDSSRDAVQYSIPDEIVRQMLSFNALQTMRQKSVESESMRDSVCMLDLGVGTGLVGQAVSDAWYKRGKWAQEQQQNSSPSTRDAPLQVVGVDIANKMIQKAAERAGIYARIDRREIVDWLNERGFEPNVVHDGVARGGSRAGGCSQVQFVVSGDVFVYFASLMPVLSAIAAILPPGGFASFTTEAMTAVEELESRRANRALNIDDRNYGLPTYVLRPSARHAHAAAYIAQTGRSVGLEVVAHRVATLRYEWGRPEHGHVVLLRRVGVDSTSTVEADKLPRAASSSPDRESVPQLEPEPEAQMMQQQGSVTDSLAAPAVEASQTDHAPTCSSSDASDWSGFAPALSALQPQCGPFARTSDSSTEDIALLSAWLAA